MDLPRHNIINAHPAGMTPRRMLIVSGVALLHVAAIYGLMTGMISKVLPKLAPDIVVIKVQEEQTPPKPPVVPKVVMVDPTPVPRTVTVPEPDVQIETPVPPTITATPSIPNTPPVPDTAPSSVSNTHTTPTYPTGERVAGHQGTVILSMVVSPQGNVVSATVVQSSGFPVLDQTAVDWVIAHWKYKPAIQGGVPVTAQAQAGVKFDLKQARR